MPHLLTATQETLRMKQNINPYRSFEDACIRVWFGIIHNLTMLLGISIGDLLIGGIFQTKLKVVPWYHYLEAVLAATQRDLQSRTSTSYVVELLGKLSNDEEASTHPICIARQTLLKLRSQNCVLVTTRASGFKKVEPRIFDETQQINFAACRKLKL